MGKKKVDLDPTRPADKILSSITHQYGHEKLNLADGVKIDFAQSWVHLRKSNTEPIIRIYTEAQSQKEADLLADSWIQIINDISI
jgi:phosphomannomutase